MEVVHNALDASIYRLPNVEPHFINCVVDPKNSSLNWSLCHDIESSIATEFSVFFAGLCRSIQYFVATKFLCSSLVFFTIEFFCSSLVFVAIGMYWVTHQTCLQLASHVLLLLESVVT